MTKDIEPVAYRSPGLPPGFFSNVGNLHMHIDGGGNPEVTVEMLRRLESQGISGKLNQVVSAIGGPQRDLLPETYQSHTPSTGDAEEFDYFASLGVGSRERAIKTLREVLPLQVVHHGIVIEVERVVGRIDSGGKLTPGIDDGLISAITAADVGIEPSPTLPFEIHHGFDIPEGLQQISLQNLLADSTEAGVMVGGWFCFARKGVVGYRSNAFSERTGLEHLVETEHRALADYLTQHAINAKVRTVVEQVVGIWHGARTSGRIY